MEWNEAQDHMMGVFNEQGKTIDDIIECLKRVPIDVNIVDAIKNAYDLGCELRIVSDANLFFIKIILKNNGILHCFREIKSNPGYVDEHGRLRILPFHNFNSSPHCCPNCPPNMCKGKVLEEILGAITCEDGSRKKRLIYIGDGVGDFCPATKLEEIDFLVPRKNFPLWNLIYSHVVVHPIKAKVEGWSNGKELKGVLGLLIQSIAEESPETNN